MRAQQQDLKHQLCRRQTVMEDLIVILDHTDKSDKEAMMQMAELGPDN